MNFESYLAYAESIVTAEHPAAPYDNPDYFNYTKLNWARLNRWIKTGVISEQTKEVMARITQPQNWIIITEPWCGDAAHVIPFLQQMASLNPLIHVEYELRDAEPHRINAYLTNGGKSIPKLIIRNNSNADLATWGPRPVECQLVYTQLQASKADLETIKTELQKWYNADKGVLIQKEVAALIVEHTL